MKTKQKIKLLTFNNVKTLKGEALGYRTAILYLAPHKASEVLNTCTHATKACRALCLYRSGMALMFKKINEARIRKTLIMHQTPDLFWSTIDDELNALRKWCEKKKLIPAVRLNGTSDLWNKEMECLMHRHADIQFYDYTKDIMRASYYNLGKLPPNYHLTYSHAEGRLDWSMWCLRNGINVAVVFKATRREKLTSWWNTFPVIDGDKSDLRFLDETKNGEGVVIGLRAKGLARGAKIVENGFINPNVDYES